MAKMARMKSIFVLCVLCAVTIGQGSGAENHSVPPVALVADPPGPVIEEDPTLSQAPVAKELPSPSQAPVAEKPKPKSTTTTTPPPSPPTNATTTTTTTTTTPKPTPKPTPTPKPDVSTWTANFTNSNNTCLVVQGALQYEVQFSELNKTVKINVPKDATFQGDCGDNNSSVETLLVSWGTNNSMLITFSKNVTKFDIENVVANLTFASENDTKTLNFSHDMPEFKVSLKNSYKCAREQTLNFTTPSANVTAFLHVSSLQFQAFRNAPNKEFASAWDCEGINTPDVVPIVVGCVLAALVVIVLVAYLFGRRRCQARGYLSM